MICTDTKGLYTLVPDGNNAGVSLKTMMFYNIVVNISMNYVSELEIHEENL